jgi:hypothetical protein
MGVATTAGPARFAEAAAVAINEIAVRLFRLAAPFPISGESLGVAILTVLAPGRWTKVWVASADRSFESQADRWIGPGNPATSLAPADRRLRSKRVPQECVADDNARSPWISSNNLSNPPAARCGVSLQTTRE